MKEIFVKYNKTLWKIIIFKPGKFLGKVLSFFVDFVLVSSLVFMCVLFFSKSTDYLVYFTGSIIAYYLFVFIIYTLIEYPDKIVYKGVIELCDHISSYFGDDFLKYDEYFKMERVPSLHTKVKINTLPTKELMLIWKYRLEERKNTYMMMLPFIAAISLINIDYLSKLLSFYDVDIFNYFEKYMGQEARVTIPMIADLLKYAIVAALYLDKMVILSNSIFKVDLLIGLKE